MSKKEILDWTDWFNSFNNIDWIEKDKFLIREKDKKILQQFKDQLLNEIQQKDNQIKELEKQLADKKETANYKNNFCINCCKDKSGEQIICLKCHEEVCNAFKKQLAELEKQLAEKDRLLENDVVTPNNITEKEVIEWLSKNCNKEGYFKRVYSIGTEQLDVKVHKI